MSAAVLPSAEGFLRRSFDRYKKVANGVLGAFDLRWKSTSAASPPRWPRAIIPSR